MHRDPTPETLRPRTKQPRTTTFPYALPRYLEVPEVCALETENLSESRKGWRPEAPELCQKSSRAKAQAPRKCLLPCTPPLCIAATQPSASELSNPAWRPCSPWSPLRVTAELLRKPRSGYGFRVPVTCFSPRPSKEHMPRATEMRPPGRELRLRSYLWRGLPLEPSARRRFTKQNGVGLSPPLRLKRGVVNTDSWACPAMQRDDTLHPPTPTRIA